VKKHILLLSASALTLASFLTFGASPAADRWWSHVKFLADDSLEGRHAGSPGHRKAVDYAAGHFRRLGLKPAGTSGFLQPVALNVRGLDEANSSLELVRGSRVEPLILGEDAYFGLRANLADSVDAPVFFVGYGIRAPEVKYDDFAGLDLKGAVVVTIAGAPSGLSSALRAHYTAERSKILRELGAIGSIGIANPKTSDIPWDRAKLSRSIPQMTLTDPELDETRALQLSVSMNPERAEKLFAGTKHRFSDLLTLASAGKPLPRFRMDFRAKAKAKVIRSEVVSHNVAAILPGSDSKLKDEYVVLTAHIDHVGTGEPISGDRIHNGAMDNASGVSTLLELARELSESKTRLRRSVLFLLVTAEEKGLLGSKYYAANPTVPRDKLVANLNIDMFLPLFPLKSVTVYGLEESTLGRLVRAAGSEARVAIQPDPQPERNLFIRSDQYSFIRQGVPALAFKFGFEKSSPEEKISAEWLRTRYHAPSDDLDQPVDVEAAARFNALFRSLVVLTANDPERPSWNQESFFRRFAK
jgi:hypothetical protein